MTLKLSRWLASASRRRALFFFLAKRTKQSRLGPDVLSLSLPNKAKPLFLRSALRPAWSIFWDGTDQAYSLTLAEKLRAGSFVSFAVKREKARPARTESP